MNGWLIVCVCVCGEQARKKSVYEIENIAAFYVAI